MFEPLPRRGWRWRAGALTLPGWPPAPAEAVTFRAPRSYTGEDAVELWVPGAPPLVAALVGALVVAGARLAEPGELTRRAFLSGRIDLTQAEAVLALTTSADRRATRGALRALAGGARDAIDRTQDALLDVAAHLEAAIDFSEEELELEAEASLAARIAAADDGLAALERAAGRRATPTGRPVVALRGRPNVGKSTLFNRLTGAGALVSDAAGTTRDALVAPWSVPGLGSVELVDTAGEGEGGGDADRRAQEVAREAADHADLVLWVVADDAPAAEAPRARPTLRVRNKCDRGAPAVADDAVAISARTGAGCAELGRRVAAALGAAGAAPLLTATARQLDLLATTRTALAAARAQLLGGDPARIELAAADLAHALEALGMLTGAVSSDAILARIFSRFCVGK